MKRIYHRNEPILLGAPPSRPVSGQKSASLGGKQTACRARLEAAGIPCIRRVFSLARPYLRVISLIYLLSAFPAEAAESPAAWRLEWEKTVKAAKEEGRVVINGSAVYEAVFREFQKKYPEIKVTTITTFGTDKFHRVMAERRAEKYLQDIILAGGGTIYLLYKANVLDPIRPTFILPEVLDESLWWRGKYSFFENEAKYIFNFNLVILPFLAYNTKVVNPRAFKSYWDVLCPEWRGRLVALEPAVGAAVDNLLAFIFYSAELGPEFLRRLFGEMDLVASRDTRQIVDWLASGKYAFSIFTTPSRADLGKAKEQGLSIDWFSPSALKEGTVGNTGPGGIGLINRAPHPNAARVAINWLLSREGQIAFQNYQFPADSLRVDIPKDDVPSFARRLDGAKILEPYTPERTDMRPILKLLDEVWKKKK